MSGEDELASEENRKLFSLRQKEKVLFVCVLSLSRDLVLLPFAIADIPLSPSPLIGPELGIRGATLGSPLRWTTLGSSRLCLVPSSFLCDNRVATLLRPGITSEMSTPADSIYYAAAFVGWSDLVWDSGPASPFVSAKVNLEPPVGGAASVCRPVVVSLRVKLMRQSE